MIERLNFPRIAVSALKGGSGKTILSIGLTAAWAQSGKSVAPFKKGPDYIDAGWLGFAANRHCYNLDTYFCSTDIVKDSFYRHGEGADIALIEGNRGLYDGIDVAGNTSTADIAKLLDAPVLLVLDCTKSTITMAALVLGCQQFDPDTKIAGVMLNRVAGMRHAGILTRSIEHHTGIPVVGAIPKLRQQDFPERHMGLVPTPEHGWATHSIRTAASIVKEHLDLDRIFEMARPTREIIEADVPVIEVSRLEAAPVRIGVVKDAAFQFYYPENLEALAAEGAELVMINSLEDGTLPEVDALYIGGGFPETHASTLAANQTLREAIFAVAEAGMPIYAECGGLIFLGEEISIDGMQYPMCGVFPIRFSVSRKPQGHGYVRVRVDGDNPFYPDGTEIRGHEFRYSRVEHMRGCDLALAMERGVGVRHKRDGLTKHNVLASYTHIHALGTPEWAPGLVGKAREFKQRNR